MKLSKFKANIRFDIANDGHAFFSIRASVGRVLISDPNQWAVLSESEIKKFVDKLAEQTKLTKSQYNFLAKLPLDKFVSGFYEWSFGSAEWPFEKQCPISKNLEASNFMGLPNGPEPFFATAGYLAINPTNRVGRLAITKNKRTFMKGFFINADSYISSWQKISNELQKIRHIAHQTKYLYDIENTGNDICYSINPLSNDREKSALTALFRYLQNNNLLTCMAINNSGAPIFSVLKKRDFTELGWALLDSGVIDRWLKSKAANGINQDLQLIDNKLAELRDILPCTVLSVPK